MKAFLDVVMYIFGVIFVISTIIISVILRALAPDWLVAISDISFVLCDLVLPLIIGVIILVKIAKGDK